VHPLASTRSHPATVAVSETFEVKPPGTPERLPDCWERGYTEKDPHAIESASTAAFRVPIPTVLLSGMLVFFLDVGIVVVR
jgi:hypothetical protein